MPACSWELVMPVANMLAAAARAGACGERRAQNHPKPPQPPGAGLPAPVNGRPGPRAQRVHDAPVRAGRRRCRPGLGPLPGAGARRRPGPVRAQHPGAARLQGGGEQGLPGPGGAGAGAGGLPAVAQLRGLPAPAGVLPGDRHAHRRCRRCLRPAGLQRPAAARVQGNDVRGGAAHLGPAHAGGQESRGTPRRAPPAGAGRLGLRPRWPGRHGP